MSSSVEKEMLEELKKIRKALEPKPTPPPPRGLWNEFLDFMSKYKVMGLAVAFIMGIYLGALIQALVNDLIMPIIQLIPGMGRWDEIAAGPFLVGHFIGALITFLIVAFVIFLLIKITKKWGIE
jgi:large conductance mechanosensitive channel